MTSFARHLKSGSIRLRVGMVEYTAHRSLLAQKLSKIDISAHERIINDFEGEDEDAVACLLEFLYTGDYKAAVEEETPSLQSSDDGAHEGLDKHHQQKKSSPSTRVEQQEEVHPVVLAARSSGLGVWGRPAAVHTRRWEERSEDSSIEHPSTTNTTVGTTDSSRTEETLSAGHRQGEDGAKKQARAMDTAASTVLTHAKVYLLAEKYGCLALMDFSLQKLRAALKTSELELPTDHTTSLVTLIKSVYSHPLDEENHQVQGNKQQQHLRDVVIAQAVDRLSMLQTNGDFKACLKDGSDFAGDLLSHLTKTQLTLQG